MSEKQKGLIRQKSSFKGATENMNVTVTTLIKCKDEQFWVLLNA